MGDGDIVLDDQELRRHHHRRQKQPEPEFLALEFQNGKGEGRQHRDHNRQQRGDRRDDAGVDEILPERSGIENRFEVYRHPFLREPDRRNPDRFVQGFERRQNHPEKWEQHRQRAGDQEGIFKQCAQLTWQLVFLFHHALPFLVIMDEPLGHLVLDHRHNRNDDEQNDRGRRGIMNLIAVIEHIINVINNGDRAVGRTSLTGEQREDFIIQLEGIDHRYHDDHPERRRQQRQCDVKERPQLARSVDSSRLIVLLVNFLKTCQKQHDLKGQAAPDIEDRNRPDRQLRIRQPLHCRNSEQAQKIIDITVFRVEQPAEHNADRDDRSDIRKKIHRLENAFEFDFGVDQDGDHQRDDQRNRQADPKDDQRILERQLEGRIAENMLERLQAKPLADFRQVVILCIKAHPEHFHQRIEYENQHD